MGRTKTLATAMVTTAIAALALASAANASSHHPTGEFAPFAECPLNRISIEMCVHLETNTNSSLTIGSKAIPLDPLTLQGGYEGSGPYEFFGAENNETLSETSQPLPGGLVGITAPGWWPVPLQEGFNELINEGFTGVEVKVQLAAPATSIGINVENMLLEEGTALGLPVKLKLENVILGTNCYIGSNEKPILLDFTTGTSGKVQGSAGELSFNEESTLITFNGLKLVDGTFAVPQAKGCGGAASFYIDPLVDSLFGLPSGSGKNSATFEGVLKVAGAETVRENDM
jgi:hypothetical protein